MFLTYILCSHLVNIRQSLNAAPCPPTPRCAGGGIKCELLDVPDVSCRAGAFLQPNMSTAPPHGTFCHTLAALYRLRARRSWELGSWFLSRSRSSSSPVHFARNSIHARLDSGPNPPGICEFVQAVEEWGCPRNGKVPRCGAEPKLWKWPEPRKLLSNWLWRNRLRCGQQR